MKDWHKQILVYLAGRKTPASPENIKQYLKRYGISKSHTAITTACKESLSDVLTRHDHSTYNDDGTVKFKRFKYSLKNDITSLNHIVKSLNDPDSQRKFMRSQYYRNWIPELVQRYADLIPPAETISAWYAKHLHEMDLNCRIKLSDRDKKVLTESLETSWIMLCEVLNFISIPPVDERIFMLAMLSHLQYDINNSPVSPVAAWKSGLLCGVKFFCKRTNTPYDDIKLAVDDLFDVLRHAPIINWEAYFRQVTQTDKYRLIEYQHTINLFSTPIKSQTPEQPSDTLSSHHRMTESLVYRSLP